MEYRSCEFCRQLFFLNRKDKRFCNRECKRKAKDTRTGRRNFTHTTYKKDSCEHCGFVALHPCQLDVDHIDGDHQNNNPQNLQTLCANCHRLKSFLNKDWIK